MSIFGRRKAKVSPDEIASVFLSEFVANDEIVSNHGLNLTAEQQQQYILTCKLYRLALVLLILNNKEPSNPKILLVRKSIESKVFNLSDGQSHTLMSQIQSYMSDLQSLFFPEGDPKELSWARTWFKSIGIDVTNPVDLTLFSCYWMDMYVAMKKSLQDFKIM